MSTASDSPLRTPTRRGLLIGGAAALGVAVMGAGPASASTRATASSGSALGLRLYDLVKQYSRWSVHRTGTESENAALDWFQSQLQRRGAATSRFQFSFPRYEWTAQVRVGGRTVDTIPYFYAGVGDVSSDKPFVKPVTINGGAVDAALTAAVQEAEAENADLAVLPVFNSVPPYPAYDGLVAVNVAPVAAPTGVPTLFIPGELADQAQQGVEAHIAASIVPSESHVITGWFGKPVSDPIVVATPQSGWFTCAAERGSGIAVALELAADLARTHPVFVVGASGHELNGLGISTYLQDAFDLQPRAVICVGSSIAAGDIDPASGQFGLASTRTVDSNPPISSVPGLAGALQAGSFAPTTPFPGDSAEWYARLGSSVPLLGFSGDFPQFHTPDDQPGVTTTPALLDTAYQSVQAAALALISA
ncbi:MAG TPA: hypothetical protein VG142_01930 [Trebonia sp.]|nr:hypothetical protein [Trebonia sp.]